MDRERLGRLTEQQRICLRHVYAHRTSKEIAPLLGIEPNSVDQHIKAAMRVLGVTERRAAAFMLAEYEGGAGLAVAMREEQAPFESGPAAEPVLPIPFGDGRPGDAGILWRLGWIAAITIGLGLTFGALVAGSEALVRLFSH
jgi:DNA-binding CsgD family transcriptional regulator